MDFRESTMCFTGTRRRGGGEGGGAFVATIAIASASVNRVVSIRSEISSGWKDTVDSKPIITFIVSHRIVHRCVPRAESAVLSNNYKSVLTEIRSICSLSRSACVHGTVICRVGVGRGGQSLFRSFLVPPVLFRSLQFSICADCLTDVISPLQRRFRTSRISPRSDFHQLV